MSDRTVLLDGVRVPRFLYGTAWKDDRTQCLTELALRQGFRGIDTANQRKHSSEAAVGEAVRSSATSETRLPPATITRRTPVGPPPSCGVQYARRHHGCNRLPRPLPRAPVRRGGAP